MPDTSRTGTPAAARGARLRSFFAPAVALALGLAPTALTGQMLMPSHTLPPASSRAPLPEPVSPSLVKRWLIVSDRLSAGIANPQLVAAVTMAMHDALNAAEPRYQRWYPPGADEAPGAGASVHVAMSMAAFRVLASVFPVSSMRHEAEPVLIEVLRGASDESRRPGLALGSAVGGALAARLTEQAQISPFPVGDRPGQWRPTPPFMFNGMVSETRPILFASRDGVRGEAPPARGSPRYLADLEEVRRDGAIDSTTRTPAQTATAEYWARQSSQRGFLHLALRLLHAEPQPGGIWDEARILSMLAAALADAATLSWEEKRFHSHWRPITAIHEGGDGLAPDPDWQPLLITPPHPDYPSGHAADCGAGSTILGAVFGSGPREVVYIAMEPAEQPARRFSSFEAAALECADSRVWAGAHFRFANDEGLRIGRAVATRALSRVPQLPGLPR
jgi:hypothetical protein